MFLLKCIVESLDLNKFDKAGPFNLNTKLASPRVIMEPIKIKPRVIKPIVKKEEPVTFADGTPYVPLKVETKDDAMHVCLQMILKHTADMFVTICEIVAEEYKMDSTEMVNTIRNSPRFEKLCAEDVLLTMGYFEKKAQEEVAAPAVVEPQAPLVEPQAPAVEKPKRKPRAPKAVAPAPAPVAEEPAPAPKKVKVRVVSKVKV
jgi:hypothetical protein